MAENNLCIALKQVGKTVNTPDGELDILNNISLDVKYQEAVVIKGASGSGKTTLLGLMAGLDQASSGEVVLLGQNLADKNEEQRSSIRAGKVGFVFQSFHLVKGANALQNVMLPLELGAIENASELAATSLQQVGLEAKAYTQVDHLSGGEQQRVAIARAFATRPTVLFADEPACFCHQADRVVR
jgi:putative ABC transport system ATP-binding protein